MNRAINIITLMCEGNYKYSDLKNNKIPLDPEERKTVMDKGAVWNFSHLNSPTPGIWKARTKNGKIVYGCNTHRAMATAPTLKGALGKWAFIKSTA